APRLRWPGLLPAEPLPLGTVAKSQSVYPGPFCRATGLSGHAPADRGPVMVVFDNSPPDGSPGVLLAFVLAGDARRLYEHPESKRREIVLEQLSALFGPRTGKPERVIEQSWAEEPWTR